jgi:hypothetical protein
MAWYRDNFTFFYVQIFSSLHYTVLSNILLYFLIYLAFVKKYCDDERNLSRDSDRFTRFEPPLNTKDCFDMPYVGMYVHLASAWTVLMTFAFCVIHTFLIRYSLM